MKLYCPEQSKERLSEYIKLLEHMVAEHLKQGVEAKDSGAMSSDRNFPVEKGIVPLVSAINELLVFQSYWSCEGHIRNGELLRTPQVWFYSNSMIYVKLLYYYLSRLKAQKVITHYWDIRIIHTDKLWDSGFCIEPDVKRIGSLNLRVLQEDACNIAFHLVCDVIRIAKEYIFKLKAEEIYSI